MSDKKTRKCSRCNSTMIPQGQRGFGSVPSYKCSNPKCPTNQQANGWGKQK